MMSARFVTRCLASLSLAAWSCPTFAQTEMSVFNTTGRAAATTFVTDYQAVGINPSNLGWKWRYENKHLAFGVAEGSYSIYSEALTREDMRNRVINVDVTFTEAEKQEAAL